MEKTLLFGAGGSLATEIIKTKPGVIALSKKECDITDRKKVLDVVKKHTPSVVINCAALTSVKYCEEHPQEAWNVNVVGVRNISEAVRKNKAFMAHFSSDYAVDPVNEYSWTKLASESLVHGLVIRANFYDKSNWLYMALKGGQEVKLLTSMKFNPISVPSLLDYMDRLIAKRYFGLVNVGVMEALSYYDFGMGLCKTFGFDKKLINKTGSIKLGYANPRDTYLDLGTLRKLGLKILRFKEDMEILKNETAE